MSEEITRETVDRGSNSVLTASSSDPFFTVIMPVYGTEEFIAEAIESILAQTFTDWELILVDDATPDNAIGIAQRYAESDKRLRIVHHETNKGVSESRNTGIQASRGKYIWFADSDDFFDDDLLQCVYDEVSATHADVVFFGLIEEYFDEEQNHLYDNEVKMEAYRDTGDSWHRKIIEYERDTHFGYSCTKAYLAEIIKRNGLSFEPIRLAEDVIFNVGLFPKVNSIAVLDNAPYHYRKIDGKSATNANSYSAREYYDLHARRISAIRDMLIDWDVFDDRAKGILGSLFGRYVLSALERTYHSAENMDAKGRKEFARMILSSELYTSLIPHAEADSSKVLALSLSVLKSNNPSLVLTLAKTTNVFRNNLYSVFTRLRSGR